MLFSSTHHSHRLAWIVDASEQNKVGDGERRRGGRKISRCSCDDPSHGNARSDNKQDLRH